VRNAFARTITELAGEDERVVLLSGDIGNRMFDDYKSRYPDRFLNCGVAEANMVGMAAGLAMAGLRPFAYTITPFVTTRVLEQIRVDVCYHDVPVTVVGVGAGLCYANLGATHHSCEDIAFLRALPGMQVVCPGDPWEVAAATSAALAGGAPTYLRLGKKGEPEVHSGAPAFEIGRAIELREGRDACLLATGNILPVALEAADLLAGSVSCAVYSFHTVKPLDEDVLRRAFDDHELVATIEEHSLIGGFGAAVAEWLVDGPPRRAGLLRVGTRDQFLHEAGDQEHARRWHGLTAEAIAGRIREALERSRDPGIVSLS
jgi:transketolase